MELQRVELANGFRNQTEMKGENENQGKLHQVFKVLYSKLAVVSVTVSIALLFLFAFFNWSSYRTTFPDQKSAVMSASGLELVQGNASLYYYGKDGKMISHSPRDREIIDISLTQEVRRRPLMVLGLLLPLVIGFSGILIHYRVILQPVGNKILLGCSIAGLSFCLLSFMVNLKSDKIEVLATASYNTRASRSQSVLGALFASRITREDLHRSTVKLLDGGVKRLTAGNLLSMFLYLGFFSLVAFETIPAFRQTICKNDVLRETN